MARGDYGPEVKSAMAGTGKPVPHVTPKAKPNPADTVKEMARDKARGITQGSPQDEKMDASQMSPPPQMPPHMQGGGNPAYAAIAASIAHAILGRGGQ